MAQWGLLQNTERVVWAIRNGALTTSLLMAGGVAALQDAVVAAVLPFSLILIMLLIGLVLGLRQEPHPKLDEC